MTKLLNDIFDNCSPAELDLLLEDYDEELADEKSLDRITAMTMGKSGITKTSRKLGRNTKTLLLIASCVSMIVAMGVGSFVAEALEYNNAVEYLKEKNISIKGMSREDIKNVYRDITTDSYTYSNNSKAVHKNTYINSVQGYNIAQNNLNEYQSNASSLPMQGGVLTREDNSFAQNRVDYIFDVRGEKEEWLTDEEGYDYCITTIEGSYIAKYVDGSEIWQAEVEEFEIDDYLVTEKGVLIYGTTPYRYDGKGWDMWSAFIDNEGKVLWKKKLDNGFHHSFSAYARENKDGTFLVVSLSDNEIYHELNPPKDLVKNKDKYMVIYHLDYSGKIISTTTANIGEYTDIYNVFKSGENYIAELYNIYCDDLNDTKFVKVNRDGKIVKSFKLGSTTDDYEFVDMAEFNGKLYISATARPINSALYRNNLEELSEITMLKLMREEFTSVLLVCDFESGRPKEFYSAKGSYAGNLSVSNRELKWSVNSIITAHYSPYTNAYSFWGENRTKTYTFDKKGGLLYETKSNISDIYSSS